MPHKRRLRVMIGAFFNGLLALDDGGGGWDDARFDCQLDPRTVYSTRSRTFHSKLSEAALEFMNNQINEWIDKHDNLSIKFATSTIGTFEGKHSEPNLILTLFY